MLKKTFLLRGLDCPNCSAKIEREIGELAGVTSSEVNLMKQTLDIEVEDSLADVVTEQIYTIVHKHEPEVEVSESVAGTAEARRSEGDHVHHDDNKMVLRLVVGAVLFALGIIVNAPLPVQLALLIAAYVILGGDVVLRAIKNIAKGRVFDENFLMSLSTVGAFIIGEYPEAVAVMLFYQVGEFFQDMSVRRSRRSIAALMDIRPDVATVSRMGKLIAVEPQAVSVGEVIVVRPGEKIPLDGIVTHGESMLDTKALTGESLPRTVGCGDQVPLCQELSFFYINDGPGNK